MSKSLQTSLILLILLLAPRPAHAQTIWYVDDDCQPPGAGVPGDPFCTIQGGVDASSDGDTVLVSPGTYTGDGNRDITLFGKQITVTSAGGASQTIIDVQAGPGTVHTGFYLVHGETSETLVEGLTIMNGYVAGDTGGAGVAGGGGGAAIFIKNGSPTVRNCILQENVAALSGIPWVFDGRGGAILIEGGSSTVIENCMLIDNIGNFGGGIYVHEDCFVKLLNCVVANNASTNRGGGIYNRTFGGALFLANTSVWGNTTVLSGGGLYNENSDVELVNSIVYGNSAGSLGPEMFVQPPAVISFRYSDLEGGAGDIGWCCGDWTLNWGPGMIDADPLFVHPENGDFHLLPGSPCIDAGNNLAVPEGVVTDLDGGPRFLDDPDTRDTGNPDPSDPELPIVDMGPYEFDPDDCNNNDLPDDEDIKSGASSDLDENGIPDECQLDCNHNDIPDSYEISEGMSEDCDANGVPDACDPDCNENAQADACDIADGISHDCNDNGVPDECPQELPGPPITQQPVSQQVEVGELAFFQVQADGVVLEYQWRKDRVDLIDTERILGSQTPLLVILDVVPEDAGEYDCVVTELFDLSCSTSDPAALTVTDPCPADINDDGLVGPIDLAMLLAAWGPCPDPAACPADLNADATVGPFDLATLLGAWGPCP